MTLHLSFASAFIAVQICFLVDVHGYSNDDDNLLCLYKGPPNQI